MRFFAGNLGGRSGSYDKRLYAMTGPTLFLDFDGVLHPQDRCDFGRAPVLLGWLEARDARVVFTTNWRASHTVEELLAYFGADAARWAARVDGCTPELDERKGCRQREIQAWLAHRGADAPVYYVALDDNAWLFEEDCAWLVLTNPDRGVDADVLRDLDTCLQLLGG